ncbi:concanavalin A-like lectin/glucanase domain-containing protein [Zopfochytrium polystomum]|nr:concanavalin A-like lectin/glucanase domain-containing protein [Zopfochytrium polystomum]
MDVDFTGSPALVKSKGGSPEPPPAGKKKKPPPAIKQKIRRRVPAPEEIDPAKAILLYPDVDNPMHPVRISTMPTHTAPQMKVSSDGFSVYTDKGYRMAKASHGVYDGFWYFEVSFTSNEKGHCRVGWSQISGDLQGPCGYDKFSYSYRDKPGTLYHQSMPVKEGISELFAEGFGPGDVIGMSILLPKVKDEDPFLRRLWQEGTNYVQFRSNPLPIVDGSEIRYFKNGKELGVAFRHLYLGKYYPAVSSYQGGVITVNFGPNFAHAPPAGAKPFCQVADVTGWTRFGAIEDGGNNGGGSPQ